jgi:hypothetical protein
VDGLELLEKNGDFLLENKTLLPLSKQNSFYFLAFLLFCKKKYFDGNM